jgi:hypothetical protein
MMKVRDNLSRYDSSDYEKLQKEAEKCAAMQKIIKLAAAILFSGEISTGDFHSWQDCLQVIKRTQCLCISVECG